MGLRDEILTKADLSEQDVYVPQWGITLKVRSLNGLDRAKMLRSAFDDKGAPRSDGALIAATVVASVYDPKTGERVFADGDMDAVLKKNAGALQVLYAAAAQLSGLGQDAAKEAEKNS